MVLLDIDGCIIDYTKRVVDDHLAKYPYDQVKPISDYNFSSSFYHSAEMKRSISIDAPAILKKAQPYTENKEAYNILCTEFDVFLATARGEGSATTAEMRSEIRSITVKSLEDHKFVKHKGLYFVKEKETLYGHILIDDRAENLEAFRASHRWAICLDRPWNQHYKGIRATNLMDAVDKCRRLEKVYRYYIEKSAIDLEDYS